MKFVRKPPLYDQFTLMDRNIVSPCVIFITFVHWSFVRKTILDDRPETDAFLVGKCTDFSGFPSLNPHEIHRTSADFNEIHIYLSDINRTEYHLPRKVTPTFYFKRNRLIDQ